MNSRRESRAKSSKGSAQLPLVICFRNGKMNLWQTTRCLSVNPDWWDQGTQTAILGGISFSRDGQVFKGSEVDRKLSCGNIQKFYDNRQSIFGNNGSLGNNGFSGNNNFNSIPNQSGKDKLDVFEESVVMAVDFALTAIEEGEKENARAQNADRMLMQQAQRHRRTYHY